MDIDTAMQRVLKRHILTGIGSSLLFLLVTASTILPGKGKESYDLMLCHLTGKPPDVAKWRVSFTLLSASNFSCFFFLWLLFSLHQSYFSVNSMLNYIHLQIQYNDQPNAELIIKSKKNADLVIRSIDF